MGWGAELLRKITGKGSATPPLPPSTMAGFSRISVDLAATRQAPGGFPNFPPPPPSLVPPPLQEAATEETASFKRPPVMTPPRPPRRSKWDRGGWGCDAPCRLCASCTKLPRATHAGGKGTAALLLAAPQGTPSIGACGAGCATPHVVWERRSMRPPPPRGEG